MSLAHHFVDECVGQQWVLSVPEQGYAGNVCISEPQGGETCSASIAYAFIAGPCGADSDDDGCTNWEEEGSEPALGGVRNPSDFFDFPDLDDDKAITILDFSIEATYFMQPPQPPALDLDGDGIVTILDLSEIAGQFLHSCVAPP